MRGHLPDGLLFINILYYGAEVAAEEEFRIMLTNAVRYLNRHTQLSQFQTPEIGYNTNI